MCALVASQFCACVASVPTSRSPAPVGAPDGQPPSDVAAHFCPGLFASVATPIAGPRVSTSTLDGARSRTAANWNTTVMSEVGPLGIASQFCACVASVPTSRSPAPVGAPDGQPPFDVAAHFCPGPFASVATPIAGIRVSTSTLDGARSRTAANWNTTAMSEVGPLGIASQLSACVGDVPTSRSPARAPDGQPPFDVAAHFCPGLSASVATPIAGLRVSTSTLDGARSRTAANWNTTVMSEVGPLWLPVGSRAGCGSLSKVGVAGNGLIKLLLGQDSILGGDSSDGDEYEDDAQWRHS